MQAIFRVFSKEYEHYITPQFEFDPRVPPSQLIKQLSPKNSNNCIKGFLKRIKKPTKNGLKTLKTLTILHLLIIYSNDFYDLINELLPLQYHSSDNWLNNSVIKPYTQFLQKCVNSRELYYQTKQVYASQITFQRMFYCINLLMELFKCIKKMSMLGRYYKDGHSVVCSSFVDVIAVQSQKIYSSLKNVLSEMLFQPKRYLLKKEDEALMKVILSESLIDINEEMKKLFLDKYFYPYGKGIGVKLFRLEEQNQQCSKLINGIINDHQDTERREKHEQLENNLFPEDGEFNFHFYEQSLMQTFVGSNKLKEREEEVIEEEDQEVNPTLNLQQTIQVCGLPQEIQETGEGTLKNEL